MATVLFFFFFSVLFFVRLSILNNSRRERLIMVAETLRDNLYLSDYQKHHLGYDLFDVLEGEELLSEEKFFDIISCQELD